MWLDAAKTSPYKFYQFWLNVDDETAEDLIKIYTLLDKDTVLALIERHRQNPAARELQKTLAREVTTLIHGEDRARAVQRASQLLFSKEEFELDAPTLEVLRHELPVQPIGTSAVEALVAAEIAKSNGEARRLVASNAVSVNGQKLVEDVKIEAPSLIKKGKNNFVVVA